MYHSFCYAGNNYGCDETGCAIGLGRQEQFINCADIAILDDCSDPSVTSGKWNYKTR